MAFDRGKIGVYEDQDERPVSQIGGSNAQNIPTHANPWVNRANKYLENIQHIDPMFMAPSRDRQQMIAQKLEELASGRHSFVEDQRRRTISALNQAARSSAANTQGYSTAAARAAQAQTAANPAMVNTDLLRERERLAAMDQLGDVYSGMARDATEDYTIGMGAQQANLGNVGQNIQQYANLINMGMDDQAGIEDLYRHNMNEEMAQRWKQIQMDAIGADRARRAIQAGMGVVQGGVEAYNQLFPGRGGDRLTGTALDDVNSYDDLDKWLDENWED